MGEYKFINEELKIGAVTAKNRLVMPPMQTDKARMGRATEDMIKYYRDRAVYSRPGLIITEHCYVAKGGRIEDQLSIADDSVIEDHYRIADAIHDGGSLAVCQISHAGSRTIESPVSASGIKTPAGKNGAVPRPLGIDEIKEIEDLFAAAAVRAKKAGYDGVEIHCAHSYLINQFWSPLTNKRTDEYGGSVENRLRFLLETIDKVRASIGDDMIIAVRLGGSDYMDGGNTEEDAVEAAKLIEKTGADLLDVSGGMCGYIRAGHDEPGYFRSMTEKIKTAVSMPVILTGGVKTLEEAEALLEEGAADMIGAGRAILTNPVWGKRL